MKSTVSTPGGAAVTAPVPLDYLNNPFNVTLDCLVNGVVSYTVETTCDDVQAAGYDPATGNWRTQVAAATAAAQSYLVNPVRAVRVNQASGIGTVTMRVLQAGIR